MLAYLSRYTHRVAISNSRLIAMDEHGVTFRWKDYRVKNRSKGRTRHKTMTLEPGEFMRRFLLHVLPKGFHRIRHYGLLASSRTKAETLARARALIAAAGLPPLETRPPEPPPVDASGQPIEPIAHPCPCCGAAMVIIETFEAGRTPRHRPHEKPITIRIDTS